MADWLAVLLNAVLGPPTRRKVSMWVLGGSGLLVAVWGPVCCLSGGESGGGPALLAGCASAGAGR